jgi:hypothetical protein
MKNNTETLVDALIATLPPPIPQRIITQWRDAATKALEKQHTDSCTACINAIKTCDDVNEFCDTDVVWIDVEEAQQACMNIANQTNITGSPE